MDRNCEFSQTSNGSLKTGGCKIFHSVNTHPLLNYLSANSVGNKRGPLDATTDLAESNTFQIASKTFHSTCMCPCNSVKESKGPEHMKAAKTVEYNPRNSASDTCSITNKAPFESLNEETGERKWDMSNVLLRPRIFCLQHAIDVEELLHSKGGGHIQVICHSGENSFADFPCYFTNICYCGKR